jgi:uncharacterized protein (DUF2267 family)
MAQTGIAVLDGAAGVTSAWLNELEQLSHLDDRHQAYRLLRATLHALRDWLNADEAADLGAQLPILIRGLYYEGWNPSATPVHPRTKDDFVQAIQSAFAADPMRSPEHGVRAVFSLLNRHISAGQVEQMRNALQKPLRDLWPQPA